MLNNFREFMKTIYRLESSKHVDDWGNIVETVTEVPVQALVEAGKTVRNSFDGSFMYSSDYVIVSSIEFKKDDKVKIKSATYRIIAVKEAYGHFECEVVKQ